jgi:N-acetylneuraminate lyase
MTKLEGILPALVTPLDEAGGFQPDAFDRLLAHLYAAGADGVYVCGQTGEGLQQPLEQRKWVAEFAMKASPRDKTVIVHVGAMNTHEAVDLARHAARIGAHAVSALPAFPNFSFTEIKDYYTAIASASDVPLLIYYFPGLAPSINALAQVEELCEIPNVRGLKFTDSDLFKMSEIKKRNVTIFYGTDEMLVAGLVMGADGGIGSFYNVMPALFVELFARARAGEWQQARAVQAAINEVIAIGLRFPVVPLVKQMLARLGFDCGPCQLPRRRLTSAEEAELDRRLAQSEVWQSLLAESRRGRL